jgi:hypothetical protein
MKYTHPAYNMKQKIPKTYILRNLNTSNICGLSIGQPLVSRQLLRILTILREFQFYGQMRLDKVEKLKLHMKGLFDPTHSKLTKGKTT